MALIGAMMGDIDLGVMWEIPGSAEDIGGSGIILFRSY